MLTMKITIEGLVLEQIKELFPQNVLEKVAKSTMANAIAGDDSIVPKQLAFVESENQHRIKRKCDLRSAQEFLYQLGRPAKINEILHGIGKRRTQKYRKSLGSSLAACARRDHVFQRFGRGIYGLTGVSHFSPIITKKTRKQYKYTRICKNCGHSFQGAFRGKYCPICWPTIRHQRALTLRFKRKTKPNCNNFLPGLFSTDNNNTPNNNTPVAVVRCINKRGDGTRRKIMTNGEVQELCK